jgi:ribonucleotide reductase beta subunit family protein with ferritin-like domain
MFQQLLQETAQSLNCNLSVQREDRPDRQEGREDASIAKSVQLIQKIMQANRKNNPSFAERFNLFPIRDEASYRFFKKQEAAIWTANEIDFFNDQADYRAATDRERHLIDLILGFFAPGDGMISNNLSMRFIMECTNYEQQAFFISQMFIELVHAETYGFLIMSMIPDLERQKELFALVDNVPYVKAKAEFMEYFTEADVPQCDRFAAFAAAEGIFFSVLFMFIFWFRSKGKFTSLTFANEQISKDECLHRDYGALRWKQTAKTAEDHKRAMLIVLTASKIERKFLDYMLEEPIGDLTKELAHGFLDVVVNNLLSMMGLPKAFQDSELPSWMNDISLTQKNNFYEVRVGSYGRFSVDAAVKLAKGEHNNKIAFDNPDAIDF